MEDRYSTTDPFVMAWLRYKGRKIFRVVDEGNKKRMVFEVGFQEGADLEVEYRNSEYESFASKYASTMDLLKRR